MGLIRKIRDVRDPWSIRLEEQRKESDDSDSPNEPENEDEEVRKKREMFGEIFNGSKPE
ncbi:MAG: hypothetical protein GKS04_05895 [Candidatus Mycalebacterium zealandia]|nr:MAG: hypothetical protein GKS04_05895 [Candidatus Mycalebacterium zealandia]